ncbi:hypothetical protein GCM10023324_30210 [Streptomyces youssoufiensis]
MWAQMRPRIRGVGPATQPPAMGTTQAPPLAGGDPGMTTSGPASPTWSPLAGLAPPSAHTMRSRRPRPRLRGVGPWEIKAKNGNPSSSPPLRGWARSDPPSRNPTTAEPPPTHPKPTHPQGHRTPAHTPRSAPSADSVGSQVESSRCTVGRSGV